MVIKVKLYSLLVLICLLITSCGDDDTSDPLQSKESLVGSWQLVEQYISPGGPTTWKTVENGYIVTFNSDFTLQDFNQCKEGTYTIVDSLLTIDCTSSMSTSELDLVYSLEFESDNTVVLSNDLCIEPCIERFNRVE